MSKTLYFFINVLLFWVLVTALDGLDTGSFGTYTALIIGGIIYAAAAFAVEPVLGFFKFPLNFWGLLVVGFVLNFVVFMIFSIGLLPSILTVSPGTFGGGFEPIPFPEFKLNSDVLVVIVASVLSTLLQILVRKLGK